MPSTSASRRLEQFIVRMPEGMRSRIRELAEHNRRSMNSEIVVILERAIFDPLKNEKGEAPAS